MRPKRPPRFPMSRLPGPAKLIKRFLLLAQSPDRYLFSRDLPFSIVSMLKRDIDPRSDQVVKVFGERMITMANDDGISKELRLFALHEPILTRMLRKFLAEGMQCMDIGASIGYYTLLESSAVGPSGNVIAIEPVPRTFTYLRSNVVLNGLTNVKLYQLAIGDRDGTAEMAVPSSSNWSYVADNSILNLPRALSFSSVRMAKLDTFAQESSLQKLDLLRMDVEGYEYAVVSGGLQTLARLKPAMLLETHVSHMGPSRSLSMLQTLKEIGYDVVFCIPRYRDFPFIASIYRNAWKIGIMQLIKKVKDKEMVEDYNILFQNVERETD